MPMCKTPRADYVEDFEVTLVPGTDVEDEDRGQARSLERAERPIWGGSITACVVVTVGGLLLVLIAANGLLNITTGKHLSFASVFLGIS